MHDHVTNDEPANNFECGQCSKNFFCTHTVLNIERDTAMYNNNMQWFCWAPMNTGSPTIASEATKKRHCFARVFLMGFLWQSARDICAFLLLFSSLRSNGWAACAMNNSTKSRLNTRPTSTWYHSWLLIKFVKWCILYFMWFRVDFSHSIEIQGRLGSLRYPFRLIKSY